MKAPGIDRKRVYVNNEQINKLENLDQVTEALNRTNDKHIDLMNKVSKVEGNVIETQAALRNAKNIIKKDQIHEISRRSTVTGFRMFYAKKPTPFHTHPKNQRQKLLMGMGL